MKPRKRLFEDNSPVEYYNKDGKRFSDEFSRLVKPLLTRWIEEGYSLRDMFSIIPLSVSLDLTSIALKELVQLQEKEER